MTRAGATGFKSKHTRGTQATIATVSSLAKETRGFSTIDANSRACSDRGSEKNEYSYDTFKSMGRVCTTIQLIYHRGG